MTMTEIAQAWADIEDADLTADDRTYLREMAAFETVGFTVQGTSRPDLIREADMKLVRFAEAFAAEFVLVNMACSETEIETDSVVIRMWVAECQYVRHLGVVPWATVDVGEDP